MLAVQGWFPVRGRVRKLQRRAQRGSLQATVGGEQQHPLRCLARPQPACPVVDAGRDDRQLGTGPGDQPAAAAGGPARGTSPALSGHRQRWGPGSGSGRRRGPGPADRAADHRSRPRVRPGTPDRCAGPGRLRRSGGGSAAHPSGRAAATRRPQAPPLPPWPPAGRVAAAARRAARGRRGGGSRHRGHVRLAAAGRTRRAGPRRAAAGCVRWAAGASPARSRPGRWQVGG